MKKNQKQNTTTETTTTTAQAARVAQPTPPPTEPTQEQKPDFYARLITERPNEAASILATLCRRKDRALRALVETHNAGKEAAECIRIAMAIAFPKHTTQQAAP